IMTKDPGVKFDDIAGLHKAKNLIKEIVIWPMMRPDIFTGLRSIPKGVLLFGPPGTGKTMIGKAIATEAQSTFFSISASALTSKWVGEGEKLVRALFAVARENLPATIFIDEIDSLLSSRTDSENEGSRRIKTEFLVQLDGATTEKSERLLVLGATNRPQELDEAARRRLSRRLYVPLPDELGREALIRISLQSERHALSDEHVQAIVQRTAGYSGADVVELCKEASFIPLRECGDKLLTIDKAEVRAISYEDLVSASASVKPSVAPTEITAYEAWNDLFGSGATT
ncbi:uncharacterized protein MONBRDRAFT_16309, partial [Monosiga brevicollis MX1]